MDAEARGGRWRPLLGVIAGLLAGATLVTPGVAHDDGTTTHLWRGHLRPKADARYLQQATTTHVEHDTLDAGARESKSVSCPEGSLAIGGGIDFPAATANADVLSNGPLVGGADMATLEAGPNAPATGWRVSLANESGVSEWDYSVGVICSA